MTRTNNPFGLTTSTDTHMMKNSEWGAVAYLSHSVYGTNQEVEKNSNSSYITGAGNGTTYGTPGEATYTYPQSTTGNITGVFDMSGGVHEYVMGNFNGTTNEYFSLLPDPKYYDMYPASQFTGDIITNMDLCNLATCGGHALHETKGWYSDFAIFVFSIGPWFIRGGGYGSGDNAGIFYSSYGNGTAGTDSGFRSVAIRGA